MADKRRQTGKEAKFLSLDRREYIANEGRWLIFKNTGEIQLIFLCR